MPAPRVAGSPPPRVPPSPIGTGLLNLPPEVITHITGSFQHGEPHAARLASTCRQLRGAVGAQAGVDLALHRALANRLRADLSPGNVALLSEEGLLRVMEEAASLPELFRAQVLDRLAKAIPEVWLDIEEAGNVLVALQTQIADFRSPKYRAHASYALATQFSRVGFRDNVLPLYSAAPSERIEAMFRAFREDIRTLPDRERVIVSRAVTAGLYMIGDDAQRRALLEQQFLESGTALNGRTWRDVYMLSSRIAEQLSRHDHIRVVEFMLDHLDGRFVHGPPAIKALAQEMLLAKLVTLQLA